MSLSKIRKGDTVQIITGKHKGETGKVIRVIPKLDRIMVNGINEVTRHQKPSQANPDGKVQKNLGIHVSNVQLLDPEKGVPTKVGTKVLEDGSKVRWAKKSGATIENKHKETE